MSSPTPTTATTPAKPISKVPTKVILRSWPKMIFMWPTALSCLIMGFLQVWMPTYQDLWGGLFMTLFGVNLFVITFDFPRATSLTVAVVVVAVVLGLILLNQYFRILTPLAEFFGSRHIYASAEFYFFLLGVLGILFIGMIIITRFDYWELSPNELIHHHGMLGDVERFTTAGLKLNKEISDVFEYLLAGAGRMILNLPGNPRPVVLDNVPSIDRAMRIADRLLDARVVRMATNDPVADAQTNVDNADL
jgi:hypothetical protein